MQIMRCFLLILCLLPVTQLSYGQKKQALQQNNRRAEIILNSNWTFNYFPKESAPKNYENFGFDDSKWPVISLPHTWRTYETTGELSPFIPASVEDDNMYWWTGWGWYRKRFSLNKEYYGRKVFLEFEGVQKNCKVWLNGKLLGEHKGTYGYFDFDITATIKPEGSDNVLVVAVNNFQDDLAPFVLNPGGDYYEYGGIIRNVRIVLKDQLHIPMQGSASHEGGTYITTPSVSDKEAVVRARTCVRNDYTVRKSCTLQTTILDSYNKTVQSVTTQSDINPGQTFMFDQTFKPVKSPKLWSPENPYLYTIRSEVIDGNRIVDVYNTTIGIRTITVDKSTNSISVNGKKQELSGGNRMQDYPWLGSAVPDWIASADIQNADGIVGLNFIRTINNLDNRVIYEQASKAGILINAEVAGVRDAGGSSGNAEQKIREIIRTLRNHPSVVFWSAYGDGLSASLSGIVQAEDPARPFLQGRIKSDVPLPLYFATDNKPEKQAGKAAKIVLRSTQEKLTAGKGSVAIISASATDAQGNIVSGSRRNLRWTITGPAVLVGPADFQGDDPGKKNTSSEWYKGFPAVNIIRSTGVPGLITVTVFSSGLASGSITVTAGENKSDNSVIRENLLNEEGRKPVSRLIINLNRLDEVPMEIKHIEESLDFSSADLNNLTKEVRNFIKAKNPDADTSSVEMRALADILADQLINNSGKMNAGDFNYNADHYNNCKLIVSYINATKLPPLFKETLRKFYARSVITLGSEKNAGDEMNWLNWIPSGGQVVIVQDEKTKTGLKGVVYTKKTDLGEIITQIYPQFAGFSEDGKERALTFINKMNPYVDEIKSGQSVTYQARPGEMILIPLYKFISE